MVSLRDLCPVSLASIPIPPCDRVGIDDGPSGSSKERTRATICEAPPRMLGPAALIARVPSETSYFQ